MKKLRQNRVISLTLLIALLSLAVGFLVLSTIKAQLIRISTDNYKQQQSLLADQIVETLSNNFVNVENQLNLMATMPEVKDIDNPDQCNTKLDEILTVNQKQLGNLARTDPNGFFVCSANRKIIGQDSRIYGTYIADLINDPLHGPVLSRKTQPAGANTFAAGLHVPVYDEGEFRGTLGGALYFNEFQNNYLRQIKFSNNGYVVVMDDNGDILYHPNKDQYGKNLLDPKVLEHFEPQSAMRNLLTNVQAGKSGEFEYKLQGTHKIGLYKTFNIPNLHRHWAIIVTIPMGDLEYATNQAGINTIFIILIVLFSLVTVVLTLQSLRNTVKNLEVQHMKDDFISITSHQLRTPATIVKQNLGLIRSGIATKQKDIDKFIATAYDSNEDQLSIIENILSVSKLEAGRLTIEKEPIVLQELINSKVSAMKMTMHVKRHKLTLDMPSKPIHLQADPTKLAMAIDNLISNSIKYTPANGMLSIKVTRKKDSVLIAIKDNGIGIPKNELSGLFLRFNRLRSAISSHIPGTGLGLYLTKKIVGLHGGTIAVESREHHGSTFTVELPI